MNDGLTVYSCLTNDYYHVVIIKCYRNGCSKHTSFNNIDLSIRDVNIGSTFSYTS